jgi:hypothetical protein
MGLRVSKVRRLQDAPAIVLCTRVRQAMSSNSMFLACTEVAQ